MSGELTVIISCAQSLSNQCLSLRKSFGKVLIISETRKLEEKERKERYMSEGAIQSALLEAT
jgi:hypothetical protein